MGERVSVEIWRKIARGRGRGKGRMRKGEGRKEGGVERGIGDSEQRSSTYPKLKER